MPLPRPKLATSFVPRPLTASEIAWLRQEGREFQEAYDQIKTTLALADAGAATADIGVMIALEEEFREFVEIYFARR